MRSNPSSPKRRIIWISALVLLGTLTALYIIPMFFPWSEWNCEQQEIDINTGRLKFSSHRFFMKISERIEDSDLSRILPKEHVGRTTPEWHRVNTFSPGVRHSPHYAFHGAISQIRELSLWWQMEEVPQAVQQKTALHLVALWKYAGTDSLASDYVTHLLPDQDATQQQRTFARIGSLEMPLVETNQANISVTVFYPNGVPLDRYQGYIDARGNNVRHGIWERWYSDGRIQLYGHYTRGEVDGRRFEWARDGKLSGIEGFRLGELVEYESENLERHPDYKIAQQIGITNVALPQR